MTAQVTGRAASADAAWRSLELVLGNRVLRAGSDRPLDIEVRTTVHPAASDDVVGRDRKENHSCAARPRP